MSQLYQHWKSQNEVDSSFVKACNNITGYGISFYKHQNSNSKRQPKALRIWDVYRWNWKFVVTVHAMVVCLASPIWPECWETWLRQHMEVFAYYCSLITKYQIYFDFVPAALFGILFNSHWLGEAYKQLVVSQLVHYCFGQWCVAC